MEGGGDDAGVAWVGIGMECGSRLGWGWGSGWGLGIELWDCVGVGIRLGMMLRMGGGRV